MRSCGRPCDFSLRRWSASFHLVAVLDSNENICEEYLSEGVHTGENYKEWLNIWDLVRSTKMLFRWVFQWWRSFCLTVCFARTLFSGLPLDSVQNYLTSILPGILPFFFLLNFSLLGELGNESLTVIYFASLFSIPFVQYSVKKIGEKHSMLIASSSFCFYLLSLIGNSVDIGIGQRYVFHLCGLLILEHWFYSHQRFLDSVRCWYGSRR